MGPRERKKGILMGINEGGKFTLNGDDTFSETKNYDMDS